MAINDALLISAAILQDYLVDKDNAQALSGGIVTAYHDNARTVLKDFYEQTSSGTVPPVYTYIPLPNPLTLSSAGTFQDVPGNDVIPYWYPWLETDDTIPDFYYITVTDANGVQQFTRENFPFGAEGSGSGGGGGGGGGGSGQQTLINLLPNGQMLAHTNLPSTLTTTNTIQNGVQAVSPATQGTTVLSDNTSAVVATGGSVGWYYIKPFASTDTDTITFTQLSNEPGTIAGNPRYQIDLSCTVTTASDSFKEFRVRFNNVNHFENGITYTFAFNGVNNNAGTVPVTFNLIKYFGSGGSAPTEVTEATFSLVANAPAIFQQQFTFGSNAAKTVGPNNDDYLELTIGLPATSTYSLSMTDFFLGIGTIAVTDYPERPDNDVFATGVVGSIPTPRPNGADLYLPLVLTQGGMIWDGSQIGKIEGYVTPTPGGNLLLCAPATLQTLGYSALGIPYARVQSVIFNNTLGLPIYGTGPAFATTIVQAASPAGESTIFFTENNFGAVTAPADGPAGHMTDFTFGSTTTGATTSNGYTALLYGANNIFMKGTVVGLTLASAIPTDGSPATGFTFGNPQGYSHNLANIYAYFTIATVAASALAHPGGAGANFSFASTTTSYNPWFQITNETPPGGANPIKITLLATDTAADVAMKLAGAINGALGETITVPASPTVTNGDYWTFETPNGNSYYVWYNVNSTGTDPKPGGFDLGIQVPLPATPTTVQISTATALAVNSAYFSPPPFQGMTLRGVDPNKLWDLDAALRFGYISPVFGNQIGTFELDQLFEYTPTGTFVGTAIPLTVSGGSGNTVGNGGGASGGSFTPSGTVTISNTGGTETRGVNANVYWFIRY